MYQQSFSPPPVMPGVASPGSSVNYRSPPVGRPPMSPGAMQAGYAYGGQQNMASQYRMAANSPLPVPPQARHKGTLAPGTLIRVGDVSVRIEKYLSEGGYAHVYLTSSEAPIYPPRKGDSQAKGRWGERGYTQHCLKRIAFEDEKVWVDVRKEIEVMKALPPNPHLTQFLASAHARLPNGGYEVYILMEFCSGGGIIDLLNKRLRDRLKEIEILNIFTDVCEAVAAMHALKHPLLHRDLKIENVLSAPSSQPPTPQRPTTLTFKLCDFGSTTFPSSQPPSSKIDADSLAMDLNKHTTLQYRSPEMVEPMLGWAVGLPSDVWALGVLLYKLCYYTTPFEEHGTLAIVNARYTFPQYPVYSPQIQHLIASMLVDHPARRPTVFEVLRTACDMSGTKPEVDYPMVSRSFAPPKPKQSTNLLDFTSPSPVSTPVQDLASTVQPGRRGRPTREPSQSMSMPLPRPPTIQTPHGGRDALQTGNGGGKAATKVDAFGMPTVAQTDKAAIRKGNASAATGNASKVDAFGMPVSTKTGNIATGNGDASATTGEAGKVDALGMPVGAKNGKVATGNGGASATTGGAGKVDASGMPKAPSLDAFGAPKGANAKLFDRLAPARPTPSFTDSFTGRIPSEATTPILTGIRTASPQPQSASPQKATFETRFPSIEMLDAGNLISPIRSPTEKPPLQAKASMMGNLTGDLAGTHLSVLRADKMPTARSTQVTGTAFKDVKEPEQEVDLMTGDGYQELEDTAKEAPETNEAPETKDSSDEEEPESANAYYPKRSSTLAARRAAFEMPANVETSPIKRRPVSMYARTEEPLSAVSAPAVVEHAAATTAPAAVQKTPIETPTEAKVKPAVKPKPVIKTEPTLDKVPTLDNDKATTLDKVPTLDKPQRVRPEIKPKPSKHGDMPTIHGYSRSSSGRSFPISRPVGSPEKRPVSPEKKPIEMGSPDKRQSVNSLIAKWGGK